MKTLRANYLGKIYLEQCQKINITDILKNVEKKLKEEILSMELDGIELIKTSTNYGGFRLWLKCPKCSNKAFNLYLVNGNLICRKCSNLSYKKQRYKGMIEGNISN